MITCQALRPRRWAEVQQSWEARPFLELVIIVLDNCGLDHPHDLDAPKEACAVLSMLLLGDFEGAWNDEAFEASDAPRLLPLHSWCWPGLLLLHQGFLLEVPQDRDRVQRIVLNLQRARREKALYCRRLDGFR